MYKTHYTHGFVSHCEMELSVSISVHINIKVPLSRLILGNGAQCIGTPQQHEKSNITKSTSEVCNKLNPMH